MAATPDDGFRSWVAYTIPTGITGLGPQVDLGGYRLSGLVLPSDWVAAAISFQVQDPNSGMSFELEDDTRTAISITSGAGSVALVLVDTAAALLPFRFVKLRSGLFGAAVDQTASPTLTLLLDPMG